MSLKKIKFGPTHL